MKKTLMACAAATACGMAFAQSSVTVYGVMDAYLDHSNNGTSSVTRLQGGGLSGSRLGFRGFEDLGGGFGALFNLEMGINPDDGTIGQGGVGFGRVSTVGLATPYGDVTLGRQYTGGFFTLVTHGLGGGLAFGNATNYFADFSVTRVTNSVAYTSKVLSGFQGRLLYALGEQVGSNSLGGLFAGSLSYTQGPFAGSVAYTTRKTTASSTDQYLYLGTSYDFGFAKLGALAATRRNDIGAGEHNQYEVSAQIPLRNSALLLDVGRYDNKALANGDATAYSLRYDYFLSKRTTLYAGAATIRNGSAATFGINGSTGVALPVTTAGESPKTYIFGMRHVF